MRLRNTSNIASISAVACALLMNTACGSEDSVQARVQVTDRTTQPLLSGEFLSIDGFYAGCRDRSGPWSVAIAPNTVTNFPELSVVMNDSACELSIIGIPTTFGAYGASPNLDLTTTFSSTPAAFGAPVLFYANARLDDASFASDFNIEVVYSDDESLATASNTAGYVAVEASVTAIGVPAPDYTLDMDGVLLFTDVNDIVQTATGAAVLTDVTVSGQTYVILHADGLNTYHDIDSAYLSSIANAFTNSIAAVEFGLVGADLTTPQTRTLIIANALVGVRSYQRFEITFNPAAPPPL